MANARMWPAFSSRMQLFEGFIQFTFGTSGAAPTALTHGNSFCRIATPVVKPAGTGLYDIFLAEPWAEFYDIGYPNIVQASYSASGACYGALVTESATVAAASFRIQLRTAAGAAVDAATGDVIRLFVRLGARKP